MKNTSVRILIWGGVLIVGAWVGWMAVTPGGSVEAAGWFGDKFGALNTLFTGLAAVGVVAALWHEREGAADREHEHKELLAAMKGQAEEMARATRMNILIAQISSYDSDINAMRSQGMHGFKEKARDRLRNDLVDEYNKMKSS